MTANDYTQMAMAAWERGDLFEAQKLLRKSAAVCDDNISYQNLAVFYMLHGQIRENGTARGASNYALRLLLRSRERKRTAINSLWLGRYCFQAGHYAEAAEFFQESFSLKNTWQAAYSRGAALYAGGQYRESLAAYQTAQAGCTGTFAPQLATASFFARLGIDRQAAAAQLPTQEQLEKADPLDSFLMLFFSENYPRAAEQAVRLLHDYVLELPVMAMVCECLLFTMDEGQAAELLNAYSVCLSDFPDSRHRLDCIKKILRNRAARMEAIQQFHFVPVLPDSCGIIGCPVHGTYA